MDNNNTSTSSQYGPGPEKLWSALLSIYNYYLSKELGVDQETDIFCPPSEVLEAVARLSDWLDLAIRLGWTDGVVKKPH